VLFFFFFITNVTIIKTDGHHYSARPFSGTVTAGESFFFSSIHLRCFFSYAPLFDIRPDRFLRLSPPCYVLSLSRFFFTKKENVYE